MEILKYKKGTTLSRGSSCATGTLALKNFTIPRKKRGDGKALLEPCPKESRDYCIIQKILSDSRLDPGKKISATWQYEEIKLIHNEELLREFSEKRAEMRSKDRHGREMDERFCFLVTSDQEAAKIYQQGLMIGDSDKQCLGNPSHGVYLHRHADVALKSASGTTPAGKTVIIFKVFLGKVKKVVPNLQTSSTHDPVVHYDSHVSRDTFGPRDSLSQQVIGSSVFFFDYNDKEELNSKPRQCSPYAIVSLAPAVNSTPSTPTIIPGPSLKLRPRELVANLKTCTVAERWGKGENATVKFKHFGASDCLKPLYISQGIDASPLCQSAEQPISQGLTKEPDPSHQNGKKLLLPTLDQSHFSTKFNITPPAMGSITFLDSGLIPPSSYSQFPSNAGLTQMDQIHLQSSCHDQSFQQAQNLLSMTQNEQRQQSDIPLTGVFEKVTSVVYSSRVIKDPRMPRRSTSTMPTSNSGDSEGGQQAEAKTSGKESLKKTEHLTDLPNHNDKISANETGNEAQQHHTENNSSSASKKNNLLAFSSNNTIENQPSYKMLKMKFRKYATYLQMSKKERSTKILALEKLSLNEKKMLLKRTNFYERFYLKYNKRNLFQNEKETVVNPAPQSKTGSEHVCQSSHSEKKARNDQYISKLSSENSDPSVKQMTVPSDTTGENMQLEPSQVQRGHFRTVGDILSSDVHNLGLNKMGKGLDMIHQDLLSQSSTTCKTFTEFPFSSSSIHVKSREEGQAESCREMKICEQFEGVNTLPFTFLQAITVPCVSAGTIKVDPQNSKKVRTRLPLLMDEQLQEVSNANFEGCVQNTVVRPQHNAVTKEQTKDTAIPSSDGILQEMEERSDLDLTIIQKPEDALHSEGDISAAEYIIESHADIIGACVEVSSMDISEDAVSTVCPLFVSGKEHEKAMESRGTSNDQNTDAITLCSEVTDDGNSNTQECVKDAMYNYLLNRFEFSQLFSSSVQDEGFSISRKHYLTPKAINSPLETCTSPPQSCNPNHFIRGVCCNLCITINANKENSSDTESTSLSIMFPDICQLSSLTDQKNDKMIGNGTIHEKTLKGDILKASTPCKDRDVMVNSHNVKFIKILAEKYNGKENASISKVRDGSYHVKKGSEKFLSSTLQLDLARKPQRTLTNMLLRKNRWSDVTNKKRNSRLDTVFLFERQKSTRKGSKWNKNSKFKSPNHNSSEFNTLRAPKPITTKSKKKNINKIMNDFRKSNGWWTIRHKLNTNRSHHQSKLSNGLVGSNRQREVLSVNDKLLSINSSARELNTSNRGLKIHNLPHNTFLQLEDVDIKDSNHQDKSTTNGNKLKEDHSQEKVLQKDTFNIGQGEEANGNPTAMTQAEEINLASNIPLDAAIELLCGSKVENATNICTSTPSEEMTQGLPHTKDFDRTEVDLITDHPTTPPKEVKLISRLRDFLTRFESTVRKAETKALLDSEEENAQEICETSQSSDTDPQQQLVQLVVLDRVELSNLRQHTHKPFLNSAVKPQVANTTEIQEGVGKECNQSETLHQNTKLDISQINIKNHEHGEKMGANKNVYSCSCISPESNSMLEITKGPTQELVDNSNIKANSDVTSSVSATQQQGNRNGNNKVRPQFEADCSEVEKTKDCMQRHNKRLETLLQRHFSVVDISCILQEGDQAASLVQLVPLRFHCKVMLQYFIWNFEIKQNVEAKQTVVTRDLVLERYLEHPPQPMGLKYEALNSFLELQMMLEAWQFVDNKMRYLSGQTTFRSLLWYDPTLYGELFKGKVGFQQQSSLYLSFQQSLAASGPRALQKYHMAVSTLNEQLQRAPNMSYYMYLKSKRERLEVEAALRNPHHLESFYLSVPLSCMINFGDTAESLEKAKNIVTNFTEIPADQLEGGFDVGKAEHLAIMFRLLQEKSHYLKACTNSVPSKISWIGMEHILYDASKTILCREGEEGASHQFIKKYRKPNQHTVIGLTESGQSLFSSRWPKNPCLKKKRALPRQRTSGASRVHRQQDQAGSIEDNHCAKNNTPEDGPIALIDLTSEPSLSPADIGSYKAKESVHHQGTITPSHLQPGTHVKLLHNSHLENWGVESHDTHGIKRNITSTFLPSIVQPYPEIKACLLDKEVIEVDSLMLLPETQPHTQQLLLSSWPPLNRTEYDPKQMQLPVSSVMDNSQPMVTVFSEVLKNPTHPSPWFHEPPSLLLPPSIPPSGIPAGMLPMSSTNHVPPVVEPPPINYPFFLLNGQTYATFNSTTSSGRLYNGDRFPSHST